MRNYLKSVTFLSLLFLTVTTNKIKEIKQNTLLKIFLIDLII